MLDRLKIYIFGESHAEEVGVRLGGIDKGEGIDLKELQRFCDRRKSGNNLFSTPRKEDDKIEIISGIENGVTTGEVIKAVIKNKNMRSGDYEEILSVPRPSHADYTSFLKYGKIFPGGGRFSGRMTLPLCVAGGIAKQLLAKRGIKIAAYISSIGNETGFSYSDCSDKVPLPPYNLISSEQKSGFAAPGGGAVKKRLIDEAEKAKKAGDSIGGTIECIVYDMERGVGGELFDGLEGKIAYSVFAVPAVKGVEFGRGFDIAKMRGSEANDRMYMSGNSVAFKSNNSGGIQGGISNGEPVTFRVAVKPTPSVALKQETVNLATGENAEIEIQGRHDCCIVPRAVVCVEAAAALALYDAVLTAEQERKERFLK